jgi:hypothetical protein
MARASAAEQRLIKHCMDHTTHAYMRGSYGKVRWRREIRWLISQGYTELEIQAVMLSKWPRWADHGGEGHHTIKSLRDRWPHEYGHSAVIDLVRQYERDDLVPMK